MNLLPKEWSTSMASYEDRLKLALKVLYRIPSECISEEKRCEFEKAMKQGKATPTQVNELNSVLEDWKKMKDISF